MTTSPAIPKTTRIDDVDYRAFIRGLKCCSCLKYGCDPHHVVTKGSGGPDTCCVPLCRECHTKLHAAGRETWQRQTGTNLFEAAFNCLHRYERGSWVTMRLE